MFYTLTTTVRTFYLPLILIAVIALTAVIVFVYVSQRKQNKLAPNATRSSIISCDLGRIAIAVSIIIAGILISERIKELSSTLDSQFAQFISRL